MIGRLSGTLVERGGDGSVILDVNGVGYELFVAASALSALGSNTTTLHVHTHVREDALTLYGFATREDREAFRTLLSVSSIGPKLALSIMSVFDAERLATAITQEDRAAFKGIPGVGKKTVERILVDLQDKVRAPAGKSRALLTGSPPPPDGPLGMVFGALVQMGFKQGEAERAIGHIKDSADGKPVENLLREALRALG